jgi:hypothetical protein
MSLCLGSQVWPGHAVLASIPGREQSPIRLWKTHVPEIKVYAHQYSSTAFFGASLRNLSPELSQGLRGCGIAPVAS